MAEPIMTSIHLVDGTLIVRLSSDLALPHNAEAELRLAGMRVAAAPITPRIDGAEVMFPLPKGAQSDGVALLDVHLLPDGAHLARYTMFCGAPLPQDAATTMAMLQAEVQALKHAFMADAAVPKLTRAERPLVVAEAVEQALTERDPVLPESLPDAFTKD
ncbi:MAG: hypothetical protein AB8B85_07375 [Paracoccaceae bacterium]